MYIKGRIAAQPNWRLDVSAFFLQLGIVHVGSCRVGRLIFFFLGHQEAGNILRVFPAQAEAGHDRHVLHLQLVAVIGALAVLQIEDEGQALLGVVLWTDIFLFVRAVGPGALAGVVNPADKVIVVGLLAFASEIGGKGAAHHLAALANRVAGRQPRFRKAPCHGPRCPAFAWAGHR